MKIIDGGRGDLMWCGGSYPQEDQVPGAFRSGPGPSDDVRGRVSLAGHLDTGSVPVTREQVTSLARSRSRALGPS